MSTGREEEVQQNKTKRMEWRRSDVGGMLTAMSAVCVCVCIFKCAIRKVCMDVCSCQRIIQMSLVSLEINPHAASDVTL